MAQYGWPDCPEAIQRQVNGFANGVIALLSDNLSGLYLHGSLAMGCFNPARSDIDLLVITRESMPKETLHEAARLVLDYSGNPRPIEVSFVREAYLHPWQYPTPFDFHFSENQEWRAAIRHDLENRTWTWNGWGLNHDLKDPDLAAHFVVTRARGIGLAGQPIHDVLPEVPRADYIDSIIKDFDYARERMVNNPVYAVLNFCRIYSYMLEGRIDSKEEAGVWALNHLPPEYHGLIQAALDAYRGDVVNSFDLNALNAFADNVQKWMKQHIP